MISNGFLGDVVRRFLTLLTLWSRHVWCNSWFSIIVHTFINLTGHIFLVTDEQVMELKGPWSDDISPVLTIRQPFKNKFGMDRQTKQRLYALPKFFREHKNSSPDYWYKCYLSQMGLSFGEEQQLLDEQQQHKTTTNNKLLDWGLTSL